MTRNGLSAALLLVVLGDLGCSKSPATPSPSPASSLKTEEEKTLYALGVMFGQEMSQKIQPLKLTPAELEVLRKGVTDASNGTKPEVEMSTYIPKIQELANSRLKAWSQGEKDKGASFRDAAAKETGAVKTGTGLVFLSQKPGTGATPTSKDTVKVHYEGSFVDGKVFDSSIKRGEPVEFPLNGVIPCWTEALQRMKVGEKAKIVCPSEIAYGDAGRAPNIPGGATLVFEVELLGIKK